MLSTEDNTLRDLQNSSYPTKAEFDNCFIIHSKYFLLLKGVSPLRSLFCRSPNITKPCPQVFSVNGSIMCSGLHFWRHWFNIAKILSKFGEQQLVMMNYACGFNQSETGKYFEWIIIVYAVPVDIAIYISRRVLAQRHRGQNQRRHSLVPRVYTYKEVVLVVWEFSWFDETRRARWSQVMVSVTCN